MNEKVKAVNDLLLVGEPGNISVDEHADYTGYKPQAVVDAMNEVFWGEWGFEEVSSEVTAGEKGMAIAQVRVWLKGVEFTPTGWGQNRVTRGDIGDARKGAQTDAIKKALSYFSIGNRAYHGLLPNKREQQAAQAQARATTQQSQTTNNGARPTQENKRTFQPVSASAGELKPADGNRAPAKSAETPKTNRAVTSQGNPEVNKVKNKAITLNLVHNAAEWMAYKESVLRTQVKDSELTEQQIATLRAAMDVDTQTVA